MNHPIAAIAACLGSLCARLGNAADLPKNEERRSADQDRGHIGDGPAPEDNRGSRTAAAIYKVDTNGSLRRVAGQQR
jgi:hypothetical protein